MTDEPSPWSRPETEVIVAGAAPPATRGVPGQRSAGDPGARAALAGAVTSAPTGYASGTVTRLRVPGKASTSGHGEAVPPEEFDLARRERALKRWFIGVAAAVLAVGLIVVIGTTMTSTTPGGGLLAKTLSGPRDTRPDLAKLCPPPSQAPDRPKREIPPPPPGQRTVDTEAGISYAAYGEPWRQWDQVWRGGQLKVTYRVGQHFVTEPGPRGDGYHASILSGSVPATVNDGMVLDLKCTGQQVAADVRSEYYFQPNTADRIRDEFATIGGLPAWVTVFRLRFSRSGLKAKDELAAVVLFDVGRPQAAILYVSIPGTHHEWDRIVNDVIDSVRPT